MKREDTSWLEDRRRREQVTRSGQAVGKVSPGKHLSSLAAILRYPGEELALFEGSPAFGKAPAAAWLLPWYW